MNIQFHHKRITKVFCVDLGDGAMMGGKQTAAKGGTTIALQVPTLDQFNGFKITNRNEIDYSISTIELDAGLAKCSSLDNYNKKIGRQITLGRMETLVFWANKHSENEVTLVCTHKDFPKLILRKSPEGDRVYFVGVV